MASERAQVVLRCVRGLVLGQSAGHSIWSPATLRGSSGSAVFGACKNMWRSAVGPERTFGSAAAADEQQVAGSAQAAAPVADGQEASWVGKRLHIGEARSWTSMHTLSLDQKTWRSCCWVLTIFCARTLLAGNLPAKVHWCVQRVADALKIGYRTLITRATYHPFAGGI